VISNFRLQIADYKLKAGLQFAIGDLQFYRNRFNFRATSSPRGSLIVRFSVCE
jgi:hypothetical protein